MDGGFGLELVDLVVVAVVELLALHLPLWSSKFTWDDPPSTFTLKNFGQDTAATTAKPAKAKAMDATSTTTSGATTRPFRKNAAAMQWKQKGP